MSMLYRRDPEVCHDCRTPLGSKIYVAKRTVIGSALCCDGQWFALSATDRVPVCGACFDPPASDYSWQWSDCPGCGRQMYAQRRVLVWHPGILACSARCRQRERRRQRREQRSAFCTICNIEIKGQRKDTRYCSNACRQWAYRRARARDTTGDPLQ